TIALSGQGRLNNNKLFWLRGICDTFPYDITGKIDPFIVQSVSYKDTAGTNLVALHKAHHDLEGRIDYAFVKKILRSLSTYELPGDGNLEVKIDYNPKEVTVYTVINATTIRVPYIYNVVKSARATLHIILAMSEVHIKDLVLQLHKGKAYSLCSTLS